MTFDEFKLDTNDDAWRGSMHPAESDVTDDDAALAALRAQLTGDDAPVGLVARLDAKTQRALRRAQRTSPSTLLAFSVVVYLAIRSQVPVGWPLVVIAVAYTSFILLGRVAPESDMA